MLIEGAQLERWVNYLNHQHTLWPNIDERLPGDFKFDRKHNTITCSHHYSPASFPKEAESCKEACQRRGLTINYASRPANHNQVECTYTITAIDPTKLQPPLPDLQKLRYTLLQSLTHLQKIIELLSTPIPASEYTNHAEKALDQHRSPKALERHGSAAAKDRSACFDPEDYIPRIVKLAENGSPPTLLLYDMLLLDAWQRTGSKDALTYKTAIGDYSYDVDLIQKVVKQLNDFQKSAQTLDANAAAELAEAMRTIPVQISLNNYIVCENRLRNNLSPSNAARVADAQQISDQLEKSLQRKTINDICHLALCISYDKATGKARAFPPSGPEFGVITIKPTSQGGGYAIGVHVPRDNAPTFCNNTRNNTRLNFKIINSGPPGQVLVVLTNSETNTQRFDTAETAAQTLRQLSQTHNLPIKTFEADRGEGRDPRPR